MFHARLLVAAMGMTGGMLVLGCATPPGGSDEVYSSPDRPTFTQIKAAPDSYKGHTVTWGGEVLAAKRLKEGTRIEILQLPLDSSEHPAEDLTKSQGRFVALQHEFLDPATIPPGTLLIVTGDVTGSVTLPLDEAEYTYPTVDVKKLIVLPKEPPAPLWHIYPPPYWGPYWRTYPHYYWGW
jgi:outer membrane lipoprotein